MEGLLDSPNFMRDRDNPALHFQHDGAEFPVTLYDRPGLSLSNLLLKGNVDAATRAIFSPQSLTPAEMKTFTDALLKGKGKSNKFLRTIVDITTNPLVIMGVVMSLLYPVKGGTNALMKIAGGLADDIGAPGWLSSLAHSGMHNLRNIPGMFKVLGSTHREIGNLSVGWGDEVAKMMKQYADDIGHAISKTDELKLRAYMEGFHLAEGKGVTIEGGTRHLAQKVYGIRQGKPLWENLQNDMSPALRKLGDKLRNWYDAKWKLFKDSPGFQHFQKASGAKGQYVNQYVPIQPRYGRLEGVALYSELKNPQDYARALGTTLEKFTSSHFKRRGGLTMGSLKQLREMEALGMNRWVDDLMGVLDENTGKMENIVRDVWESVSRLGTAKEKSMRFSKNLLQVMKDNKINVKARLGSGKVAESALREAGAQLSAVSDDAARFGKRVRNIAEQITHPATYDMGIVAPTQKYIASTAPEYIWSIKDFVAPTGEKFVGAGRFIMHLADQADVRGWQRGYVQELLGLIRGFKPYKSFRRSVRFNTYKANALRWLNEHPLPQKVLDKSSMKWLKDYFGSFNAMSAESVGAQVSSHFYLSTLGANISPASKNLLQNWLTTAHVPGMSISGVKDGMIEFAKRTGTFTNDILSNKKPIGDAFNHAFSDYVGTMGKASGMTKAMIAGGIEREGLALPGLRTKWDKIKSIMLGPFSLSEHFNRLSGYYAAKNSALIEGKTLTQAAEYAGAVTHASHFPGGPLGMPAGIIGLWSPFRQFMHFPLRYAGYLKGSTAMATGPAKYTTLARAVGGSAGAYVAAKNLLGIDISAGLAAGALPVPTYEGQPFYPWPLVPPALSVAGSVAQSVHKGEAEDVKRAAALLVPGGLAIRRLYKTLGPKYATYDSPTPDGRIPVYNDKRALIGAFTPWQLTMKSLGLQPTSQQAEYGAAKWLLTQREKIREFRREYLEALSENDNDKAMKINRQFQRAYPELGPLQIKKTDIKAVHNRREISRLHRIMKGFPKEYQPLFNQMVGQASLSAMTEDLSHQPLAIDLYTPMVQNLP